MLQNKVAKLIAREDVSDKVVKYTYEMITPLELDFKSGQYINVLAAENVRRSYSIASSALDKKVFELYIDLSPDGPGCKYFAKQEVGFEMEFIGPLGIFFAKEDEDNDILFIATGTGIAPLRSIYLELLKNHYKKKITVLFGVRYIKDQFLVDELEMLSEKYSNFSYEIILSKPESDEWSGEVGHVQELINKQEVNFGKISGYICGGQKMINDVKMLLEQKGVKSENIHHEKFF